MKAVAGRWEKIAAAKEAASLAEGALLIAAEEYVELDVDAWLRRIEGMGETLRARLRADISSTDALIALNHYLFEELGFCGNSEDYYDPRNSYLNDVIERRRGIPITLAVLYIEIGRRIGLPLYGVSFPAHFLVKCALRDGTLVLDPYARGASLGLDDLQARLESVTHGLPLDEPAIASLLAPATPQEIFARILRNLRAIHAGRGEDLKALGACHRIVALQPEAAEDIRERADLHAKLECMHSALADYRRYLALRPQASDTERINSRIAELEPLAARLH